MNQIARMIVASHTFIQFRSPENDEPMFVTETYTDDAGQAAERFQLDAAGEKMPIGVKVYGPGSKPYRRVYERIQTENLKRGKKGLTGAILRQNETDLLSETTFEHVNFEYQNAEGVAFKCDPEGNAKMYDDGRYVAIRDQVGEEQGDLGKFSRNVSTV